MFLELAYSSKAVPNLCDKDIQAIQSTSSKWNVKNDISGCLIFHKQYFVGILVGNERIVRGLFLDLASDLRHTDITLLAKENTPWRQFDNWNMIFQVGSNNTKFLPTGKLYKNNIIGLAQIVEKRTYTSRIFWNSVIELMNDKSAWLHVRNSILLTFICQNTIKSYQDRCAKFL